jgi:hypothetical protein
LTALFFSTPKEQIFIYFCGDADSKGVYRGSMLFRVPFEEFEFADFNHINDETGQLKKTKMSFRKARKARNVSLPNQNNENHA